MFLLGALISRFLPTPSARRATLPDVKFDRAKSNFYPRPPRGGRQGYCVAPRVIAVFLPTPSARRATACSSTGKWKTIFLPTPSARRATSNLDEFKSRYKISTHALREEGDLDNLERRVGLRISTHALREEGDRVTDALLASIRDFYPRPPRGGRLARFAFKTTLLLQFLPTPSARRATKEPDTQGQPERFLPTPSARRATGGLFPRFAIWEFLPTPSARRATRCC